MSQAETLPKQTRYLVRDLLFQNKYNFSSSQMDMMAYFANVSYWATEVKAGFYVITSKKILSDLPHIHNKTLEATISFLKEKKFIETILVDVPQWHCRKVRAIKLTDIGLEYNNHLFLPKKDSTEVLELKKLYKDLELTVTEQAKTIESKDKEIAELLKNMYVPSNETKAEPSEKVEEKKSSYQPNQDLVTFIEETSRMFGKTGEILCNFVPTWTKNATFSINSYGKLSVNYDNSEKQIKNASKIKHFWLWLFQNQHRLGECLDFSKALDLEVLKERYIGLTLTIRKKSYSISNFIIDKESKNSVAIEVLDGKEKIILKDSRTQEAKYYEFTVCEAVISSLL